MQSYKTPHYKPIFKKYCYFCIQHRSNTTYMNKGIRFLSGIFFLVFALPGAAADDTIRKLYHQLDEAIANFPAYVRQKEDTLTALRKAYADAKGAEKIYEAACDLASSFNSYRSDSVLYYQQKAKTCAMEMGRQDLVNLSLEQMAMLLIGSNAYVEAEKMLKQVDTKALKSNLDLHRYYEARYRYCLALGQNAIDGQTRKEYTAKADAALDSILLYINDEKEMFLYKLQMAIRNKNLDEAKRLLAKWESTTKPGDREYAYVAYYQSMFSEQFGRPKDMEYWLLHSSISDVKNAITDQAALLKLVLILQKNGDYERAYRYIHFTWECSQKYNNRQRSSYLIPILTAIDTSTQMQLKKKNQWLRTSALSLGALFLIVLGLAYFLNMQRKKLWEARTSLKKTNERLTLLNKQLQRLS